MNTLAKGIVGLSMAALVLASFASIAQAARAVDTAERRLHPGRGFWSDQRPASSYRGFAYRAPFDESRRSYSYQVGFVAGGKVVVTVGETKLMRGTETLGFVTNGQQFTVLKVEGPWLGAEIEVGGTMLRGWIWNRHVAIR